MYKVIGGKNLEEYHLYSWKKKAPATPNLKAFEAVSRPQLHVQHVTSALKEVGQAGPTGAKLQLLAHWSKDLEIVCWPGVPGEFICKEEIPACPVPTIMWDPYLSFRYYSRTVGAKQKTTLRESVMPAWMVLGHELGHYRHYVWENRWFVDCLKGGDIGGIEAKNLKDHEQPMLRAKKLPERVLYLDFKGSSTITGSHATIIESHKVVRETGMSHALSTSLVVFKSAVRTAEREEEERKRKAREERLKDLVGGTKVCEFCRQRFTSNVRLNQHQLDCRKTV